MTKEQVRDEFDVIFDGRYQGYIEISLTDILIVVMCAVMCGWTRYEDIELYGREKFEFLHEAFGVEKVPSDSTICRALQSVSGEVVVDAVINIMRSCISQTGEIISIDGKAIRQTYQDERAEKLQIVTAFCAQSGLILGSRSIPKKTNEIPVLREMLELFNIAGKTITADALHCQNETVEKIVELGGNYVIGLKKNQKNFYYDVKESFEKNDLSGAPSAQTVEKNKGRIEKRTCTINSDPELIERHADWHDLKTIIAIDREIEEKGAKTSERSFYISNLEASPERFLEIVRQHWAIEGGLHYSLDCGSFDEDDCQIQSKDANVVLNIFRKAAIGLHINYINATVSTKTKPSLKNHLKKCLLNNILIIKILHVCKNLSLPMK